MEDEKIIEEGKKTEEGLGATSAPEVPNLTNEIAPTEEEVKDAELTVENPEVVDAGNENTVAEENTEPVVNEEPPVEENGVTTINGPKTFTQEDVNKMMGDCRVETRRKTLEYIYGRYGVADENEMDDMVGNAQKFDTLRNDYKTKEAEWKTIDEGRNAELLDLKEKVALMESGIDRERYEDARLILKGKGIEVTAENIANELATHPEWKKAEVKNDAPFVKKEEIMPKTTIKALGNSPDAEVPEVKSEEERAMHYFERM